MAGNMKIHVDLSEDVQIELAKIYAEFCESLKMTLGTMHGDLEEICKKTHYEPMVKVVNQTIEHLTGDIKEKADSVLQEWIDGDGSFVKAAEHSRAGDDAKSSAQAIEDEICDAFEAFWNPNPMGDKINVDTSRPKVEGQDFDELAKTYQKVSNEIDAEGEKKINDLKKKEEDSPTYSLLIPAVIALYEPLKTAFEKFQEDIAKAKGDSQSLAKDQMEMNDEAATNTKTAASAEDIAAALKMFDD